MLSFRDTCPVNFLGAFKTFLDFAKLHECFPSATNVALVPLAQRALSLFSTSCAYKTCFNWYSECVFLGVTCKQVCLVLEVSLAIVRNRYSASVY